MPHRLRSLVVAILAVAALAASPAAANSHLWRINEVFSSGDGKIQFIEMLEVGGSDNETAISDHWYATNVYNQDHSELLGSDLPFGTANKNFLVGSESYAALPGVPAPDYVLPDNFMDPNGDLIVWWFYDAFGFEDELPTDGIRSLDRWTGETLPNSPTNFAGETGSVVLGAPIPALPTWGAAAFCAVMVLAGIPLARRAVRRRYDSAATTQSFPDSFAR